MRRLILVAVVAVVLAGCGANTSDPDPTREQPAVDALQNASDALADVRTYETTTEMTVEGEGQQLTGEISSAVNLQERKARTVLRLAGTETTSYLVNYTVYMDCPEPWGWGREEFESDERWEGIGSSATRVVSLLKSGDVYWNGTEQLGDREAILVTGLPPEEGYDGPAVGNSRNLDDVELRGLRVKLWLDAETRLPIRSELRFEGSSDDVSATGTVLTEYHGYDEPVTISVPDEVTHDPPETGCPGT